MAISKTEIISAGTMREKLTGGLNVFHNNSKSGTSSAWQMNKKIFSLLILLIGFFQIAYSHPGRTAADGCHYCRTNCDQWGVEWNVRHCHNRHTLEASLVELRLPREVCNANEIEDEILIRLTQTSMNGSERRIDVDRLSISGEESRNCI